MPKTSTVTPLMRATASNFTISLGMINVTGNLYPIAKADTDVESHLISPDGNPVVRRHLDEITGKMYEENELQRIVSTESSPEGKVVDAAALKALRQSELEKNLLEVTIHATDEVQNATFPSKHAVYVFIPNNVSTKAASYITRALVDNPQLTMMGLANIRSYEGLYRVIVFRNCLALQRHWYPSEMHPHEVMPLADACKETVMFGQVMTKLAAPFDGATYRNAQVERVRTAVAVLETTGALTPPPKAPAKEDDIMDALSSYLESLS